MISQLPHQIFWLTSRAAGIGALLLASASVGFGLLMGGRMTKGPGRMGDMRVVHEALTLSTLGMLVLHGGSLFFDHYMHPSVIDLTVPFAGPYRPVWNGLGIAGGWILLVLGLSYYARDAIGVARWRTMHRFAAVGWLLGIIHAIGAGTDAGELWFVAMLVITTAPSLMLLIIRVARIDVSFGGRSTPAVAKASSPAPVPARASMKAAPAPAHRPRTVDAPTTLLAALSDGAEGILVFAGNPAAELAAGRAIERSPAFLAVGPDAASLPWLMVQIGRDAPAGTELHALVSPRFAAGAHARMDGLRRWFVHVAPSDAAWADLAERLELAAARELHQRVAVLA